MASSIHLQGTTLEGGGQLVRLALSLSALISTPIRITNIRGNRSGGGGLKGQHLTALEWLSKACDAKVEGAMKKSRVLVFEPDVNESHSHSAASTLPTVIDIGSPGAITLVFQALLPFLLFHAPSTTSPNSVPQPIHLTLKGGTNVSLSPSYDYLSQVLLPTLSKIGLPPIHLNPLKRGWTTGAHEIGALSVTVDPLALESSLPAFSLTERGEIANVNATVLAPRSCEKDFQRELRAEFADVLPNTPIEIKYESSGHAKRLYLLLVATTSTGCKLGRDWLYDRRITSLPAAVNQMVKQVVGELKAEIESGACVDEYCADQLVVFRALAKGRSVVNCGFDENGGARERSLHEQTAWWVAREMLGVELDEDGGCEGVGFVVGERLDGRRAREESELEEIEERIERLEVT